jgi:2-oxoglutarate ferredoxin oxidoreductase subunit alpha
MEEIVQECPWATVGKPPTRERNIITSLDLVAANQEKFNQKLQAKYAEIQKKEVRVECIKCEDAEYILVAYGCSARLCMKSIDLLRAKGIKVGLVRPITLFPYPSETLFQLAQQGVKGFLAVELSAGQMVEDVQLAVKNIAKVEHFGRMGGMIPSPEEIVEALENKLIGGK